MYEQHLESLSLYFEKNCPNSPVAHLYAYEVTKGV